MTGSVRYTLQVYNVDDQDTITLLDTLHWESRLLQPRVDHQSGRVYIPCPVDGVLVVKYDGSKLLIVKTLRCVRFVKSLAIVSSDTLYVWDEDENSKSVCLVDVTKDTITQRLQTPRGVPHSLKPSYVSFLGETLLVCHGHSMSTSTPLVIYQHGVSTTGKVISMSQGLDCVGGLTTDNHSSFLLTGGYPYSVYVLDISGDVTHTIPIFRVSDPADCTVVGEELWIGNFDGEIIVMSSL